MKHTVIVTKRIYEPPDAMDGLRVLADRLWPRGIAKKAAAIDAWLPEIAPTGALRSWFGHDPQRYEEFRERYLDELRTRAQARSAIAQLAVMAPAGARITLLYAAREESQNNATVLREHLSALQNGASWVPGEL